MRLESLATFKRRGVTSAAGGISLGAFADLGQEWAEVQNPRGSSVSIGGLDFTVTDALLSIHDTEFGRSITAGDRVSLDGGDYEVALVHPPLGMGAITFTIQGIPGRSALTEALNARGETVTLRRVAAAGPNIEKTVRAIAVGFSPEELIGGIDQGARKIIVPAADVEAVGFPVPFKTGGTDKIVLRGKVLNIQDVDDSTWRVAGQLVAYEIRATG